MKNTKKTISKKTKKGKTTKEKTSIKKPTPVKSKQIIYKIYQQPQIEIDREELNSEVKIIEYFDDRYYKFPEEKENPVKVSVTTVLGLLIPPFIPRWRGDIGNEMADYRSEEAKNKGSIIHEGARKIASGGGVIYNSFERPYSNDELKKMVEQFKGNCIITGNQEVALHCLRIKKFLDIVHPRILFTEQIVRGDLDAGTLDLAVHISEGIYDVNGKEKLYIPSDGVYIIDYKSGREIDDNAYLQISRYAILFEQNTGLQVMGAMIIHTNSSNKTGIEGLKPHLLNKGQIINNNYDYLKVRDLWFRRNSINPKAYELQSIVMLNELKKEEVG